MLLNSIALITLTLPVPDLVSPSESRRALHDAENTSSYVLVQGCRGGQGSGHPTCASAAEPLAHVRCCRDSADEPFSSGKWGMSICTAKKNLEIAEENLMTYADAVAECAAKDARLCTLPELTDTNIACGTGCSYDSELVWTSESCETITPVSPLYTSPTSGLITTAGCDSGLSNVKPKCASPYTKAHTHCCGGEALGESICNAAFNIKFSATNDMTYEQAVRECADKGLHLCSMDELYVERAACDTTCNLNGQRIWTREACTTDVVEPTPPPPPIPAFVSTGAGCATGLPDHPVQCTSTDTVKVRTRCCTADSGMSICLGNGQPIAFAAGDEMTYREAMAECEHQGAKLCTVSELHDDGKACLTGCGWDSERVWTRDECEPGPLAPAIENVPKDAMQVAGCPSRASKEDQCALSTSTAAIRCCKDDGTCISTCKEPGKTAGVHRLGSSPHDESTLGQAIAECALQGARLCSAEELRADTCCGTGCGFDGKYVWTHSSCDGSKNPVPMVTASNEPGLEIPTGAITVAGSHTAVDTQPPTCASVTSTAYVRCCTADGGGISVCTGSGSFKPQTVSQNEMDYAAALAECAGFGARLCSVKELIEEKRAHGTGCGLNSKAVWTQDVCNIEPEPVVPESPCEKSESFFVANDAGQLVIEAESATPPPGSSWFKSSHIAGATGGEHMVFHHSEFLPKSVKPARQDKDLLTYPVYVHTAGDYIIDMKGARYKGGGLRYTVYPPHSGNCPGESTDCTAADANNDVYIGVLGGLVPEKVAVTLKRSTNKWGRKYTSNPDNPTYQTFRLEKGANTLLVYGRANIFALDRIYLSLEPHSRPAQEADASPLHTCNSTALGF